MKLPKPTDSLVCTSIRYNKSLILVPSDDFDGVITQTQQSNNKTTDHRTSRY